MKATFDDYLNEYPRYRTVSDTPQLRKLFDTVLNRDDSIIAMYNFAILNKPAIAAICNKIEDYYDSLSVKDFTIDMNCANELEAKRARMTKQAIGAMVGTIMHNLGLTTTRQKNLPESCTKKYFSSGSMYTYKGGGSMRIVQTIVENEEERQK